MEEGAGSRRRRLGPSIWLGRIVATGFTALYFYVLIDASWAHEAGLEVAGLVVLLGIVALAVVVAWYDAFRGSLALAVSGLALAVFGAVVAERSPALVALLLGGPYVAIAGILWLGALRRAGQREV